MAEIELDLILLLEQVHLRYLRHSMGRVRIESWALIRPAKVKADACSIGGNTLHICSYTFIRTQSYVCLFACEYVWFARSVYCVRIGLISNE